MTPFEILILLDYFGNPTEDTPNEKAPIWPEVRDKLLRQGLLQPDVNPAVEADWALSEKGRFYVAQGLCKVPLPVEALTIPWGNEEA